jgi:predicted Zn-dependent protease
MRARFICLCFATLVIVSSPSRAETRSIKEHNFSVEIPDGWSETSVAAPTVFAAKSADSQKAFVVITTKIPDKEKSSAARSMAAGAKDAAQKKGWKTLSEGEMTMAGLEFKTLQMSAPDGMTTISWMTSAGDEAYILQGVAKTGDASTDADLRSIMRSFRLLSPAQANPLGNDKGSLTYKAGYFFGCCFTFAIPVAIIVAVIIWRRRKTKSNPTTPQ